LPAFASALGRVLLSGVEEEQLRPYLHGLRRKGYTDRTVTDVDELVRCVDEVRRQGWALMDQELELGVREVAVPVRSRTGTVVAAISVATNVSRVDVPTLTTGILPHLLAVTDELERDLTAHVPLPAVGVPPSHLAAT
jgi:IclR family pca regulon transcriptional regulator